MAEVLVFHHAYGLTEGVRGFAGRLRAAGHTVHTPDLFEGRVFDGLEEGVGYAQQAGFATIVERGSAAARELPAGLVYLGFSLGVLPAQKLAQTRPGARGALLLEACLPVAEFGSEFGPELGASWPVGVPVQVHGMDADPFFAGEGDLDAARALVEAAPAAELFLYPGDRHLFTDPGLPSYEERAAAQVTERVLDFLDRLDQVG
ncbi:dienelactone hydrolase family protein [Streptomyces sp. NRRL WC-3742]|uniref:dienelactone hydrolase family protein n=1 Tax=Streptomyces sp. NRRL WC-3742 TaxID=1463934 RepID=UPI0004C5A3DB|nr:dienelactone hydrolase family protein [Streptomyces sp. NRRL WC-3742]